jgi:hypothetical protein
LNQALLQACDDFRIHAPTVLGRDSGDMRSHAMRQTEDKVVSRMTGVLGLIQRMHNNPFPVKAGSTGTSHRSDKSVSDESPVYSHIAPAILESLSNIDAATDST